MACRTGRIASLLRTRPAVVAIKAAALLLMPLAAGRAETPGERSTSPADLRVPDLVDGMLARAEAIYSGHFTAIRSTGFRAHPKSRASRGPYTFSLSGDDWARRTTWDAGSLVVNRNHQTMRLWRNPPDSEGTRHHGALFGPPTAPRLAEGNTSPFYAGTFWSDDMLGFVRRHRGDARHTGRREVAGAITDVLEWEISADQRHEVMKSSNPLIVGRGGILRVYIAEHLGYALPLIERVNPENITACAFESSDFREVADGIWFPFTSCKQWFDPSPAFYEEYVFTAVTDVNREIDNGHFAFAVPAGTTVVDERDPAEPTTVVIGREAGALDIEKAVRLAQSQTTPFSSTADRGAARLTSALIVANVVILLILGAAAVRIKWRHKTPVH